MVFYTVKSVEALDDYVLSVLFTDGVTMLYDVKPLFEKWKVFKDLQNVEGLYQQVGVIADGYAIGWNDKIDLSCNELRRHGRKTSPYIAGFAG